MTNERLLKANWSVAPKDVWLVIEGSVAIADFTPKLDGSAYTAVNRNHYKQIIELRAEELAQRRNGGRP